jgi:hypothetical protein
MMMIVSVHKIASVSFVYPRIREKWKMKAFYDLTDEVG